MTNADGQPLLEGSETLALENQTNETADVIKNAKITGDIQASAVQEIGAIVDGSPTDAVAVIRQWMDGEEIVKKRRLRNGCNAKQKTKNSNMMPKGDYNALSGMERSAIFMLALGRDYGQPIWTKLDDEEVAELSQSMAKLGNIRPELIEYIFGKFCLADVHLRLYSRQL